MTSPIKPPSGPPVAPLAGPSQGAAARPGSSAGEEFKASLDAMDGADGVDGVAGRASAATGAAEASGVQALTAALRTGELSPAQALDALVAQALQAPDAQRPRAGRAGRPRAAPAHHAGGRPVPARADERPQPDMSRGWARLGRCSPAPCSGCPRLLGAQRSRATRRRGPHGAAAPR
ncbi:MAG: hypothetical protein IPG81_25390 [Sandaracinaceae bacterium]|nr:hypothetical protein [Sandaracinaceae bacterium]